MKEISIALEGEEAVFYWKDGKVYCEGYDLESEKAVLALTRFGKGIGVLLAAMNTCCENEKEFRREVKRFVTGHKWIIFKTYSKWPRGQLIFEYFSYSPDSDIRWAGMYHARLTEKHYQRMLKDPKMEIKEMMTMIPQLPEKYFHSLARYSIPVINGELARNKNCPSDLLEVLASDKESFVRQIVALNPRCPQRMLVLLAQDDDSWVRRYVACNPKCPPIILENLAFDPVLRVVQGAAQNPSCPAKILSLLARDKEAKVRQIVALNPRCPERILEYLARDEDAEVRRYVAINKKCPPVISELLDSDIDRGVRRI